MKIGDKVRFKEYCYKGMEGIIVEMSKTAVIVSVKELKHPVLTMTYNLEVIKKVFYLKEDY